jgi:hypothetical protein
MPHDVFLSYASTDRAAAEAICTALETRGIRCWVAPRDVPAGADWGEAILSAIGRAHAMVLVLSRTTANSTHVRNEVVTAVSQSLALCPVRIEDCQPGGALRLHLAGSHWLNVYPGPVEQHADALAAGVRLALAADATIEIPRAQAAALVAAARASHAAGQQGAPMARPTPALLPPRPAGPAAPLPVPSPAPVAARPEAGRGLAIGIGVGVALLALAAAAWFLWPQLRPMIGEATQAPVAIAGTAPATPPADDAPAASSATAPEVPAWLAARLVPAAPPPRARPDEASAPRSLAPTSSLAGLGGDTPLPQAAVPPPVAPAESPRRLAPSSSLAGIGGSVALPRASAPPPVPLAERFAQSPPTPLPAAAVPPAPAPAARVMNVAPETISRLFVARIGEGVGREDWLGNAQITPGNAVQIRAPQGQGCVFNIRAVYVGGRTEDRPGVDLCAAPELRFEGSKRAGAASSR